MLLAGHQPNYLPNLSFFKKMHDADKFIFVDHIQYRRHDWQNRNKIRTSNGEQELIIPVKRTGQETPINQMMIDNTKEWKRKHWASIELAYKKAPFWDCYADFFKKLYEDEWNYLTDINCKIIGYLITCFDIQTAILGKSSNFGFKQHKTDLLIEMTKHFGCNGYLNGMGAKEYVDEQKFKDARLVCAWLDFKHPIYKQMHEPFIPNMSAIDLLFNYGLDAKKILFENVIQKKEM